MLLIPIHLFMIWYEINWRSRKLSLERNWVTQKNNMNKIKGSKLLSISFVYSSFLVIRVLLPTTAFIDSGCLCKLQNEDRLSQKSSFNFVPRLCKSVSKRAEFCDRSELTFTLLKCERLQGAEALWKSLWSCGDVGQNVTFWHPYTQLRFITWTTV